MYSFSHQQQEQLVSDQQALVRLTKCCPWLMQCQRVYYNMEIMRFINESKFLAAFDPPIRTSLVLHLSVVLC